MDDAWERAVEAARGGEDPVSVSCLTLDSALKCFQGRLPSASLLEKFSQLRVLSFANVGLTSLTRFPSLPHLERLILSDNRIAGGLENLVEAGLLALRDLDLSNNKVQHVKSLAPLAQLHLVSLDLCECPVTRLPDYRAKAFAMIKSLQYLDKVDAENNERPESEGEDDFDDGIRADVGDEDAQKVGTIFGSFAAGGEDEGDVDEGKDDEDNESEELDEDEEALPCQEVRKADKNIRHGNEESDSDEEQIDDDDGTRNAELQDVEESEEEAIEDDDGGEDKEGTEQASGPFVKTEGSFDGQEDGNDCVEENGEIGDEEEDGDEGVDDGEEDEEDGDEGVDDDEKEEEDYGTDYLVQPIAPAEEEEGASDFEPSEDDEDDEDEEDIEDDEEDDEPTASLKRKRSKGQDVDTDNDDRPPKH